MRTYPHNIAAEFARALSTEMVTTRSRATRRPDDTAFKNFAQRFGLHSDTKAAFQYITNVDRQGDSYAIGLVQALHASSDGPDQDHAPAYEAPGLSPAASWRGGPHGRSTIIQLASDLVDNPDDTSKLIAFEQGLHDQGIVIKNLLKKQTANLEEPGAYISGHDMVQKCGKNGGEAWRLLHRRFDPATGGRKRNLLRAIISPGRCKIDDLQAALTKWELMVQRALRLGAMTLVLSPLLEPLVHRVRRQRERRERRERGEEHRDAADSRARAPRR